MIISQYDKNGVRYQLVKTIPGETTPDWLFLPGGPGADSCYYLSLIECMKLPGNYWLIDFPANGSNFPQGVSPDFNFDLWGEYFIPALQRFEKPILLGQSFGGMFPLLFPELENVLQGFIVFGAAPKLWFSEAVRYAKEHEVITSSEAGEKFRTEMTEENFRAALLANAPCHFPPASLEKGKKMFSQLPFNYRAMLWWIKKAQELNFDAKWIPQSVPTLILGGARDFIVPPTVFEADQRFHRDNIKIKTLANAGHFIWLDEMDAVVEALCQFYRESI